MTTPLTITPLVLALALSGLAAGLSASDTDLMVTKTNAKSTVHRPVYMDCVTLKRRDAQGALAGLYCFIGLFSSGAYSTPPRQIPLLRKKVEAVFAGTVEDLRPRLLIEPGCDQPNLDAPFLQRDEEGLYPGRRRERVRPPVPRR